MAFGHQQRNRDQRPAPSYGNGFDLNTGKSKVGTWISQGINGEAIKFAEAFGGFLAKPPRELRGGALTTSQIRIAYGEITRLKMRFTSEEVMTQVLMLKPKLAYAASRGGETNKHLKEIISEGIDAVDKGENFSQKKQRFINLANFFEAILAYHKANGGK